ncbi:hypothetical protein Poli38472_003213 [Pythium oligandrum]|uniref:Uncharacterized protein n=1 Tax=Pythium oligandrum TaxID=41045 RepID=A0A8K1C6F2_PYTOL|nr:hypothetical protein Poli38472_003213 [Pythium oligandrum]|eukprot:TMW57288.1 hypothetical protein Poli38472_003213 [Pythium oligandrum]
MARDDDVSETPRRGRGGGYDAQMTTAQPYAVVYGAEDGANGSSGAKRKRVKKNREESEWMPPPPPPPPFAQDHAVMMNQMHVPTILQNNSHHPMMNYATANATGGTAASATTVFAEAPVIQSFAETERKRNATTQAQESGQQVSNSGKSAGRASVSQLGGALGPNATSILGLFHPDAEKARRFGTSHDSVVNGEQSSKRRRKGESNDRSTRSSRRNRDSVEGDQVHYDMLRFGVDSVKLVPQGLADRMDARMKPDFVAHIVSIHTENWLRRAGFGHNFVPEITALLTAYYPCTYPTILDEIVAAFVFKRPELCSALLKPMIEKFHKTGESASPTRYPVLESFARICNPTMLLNSRTEESHRHVTACSTLLRYLFEQNTEKFMLSPWIASCAAACGPDVLTTMWKVLIEACLQTGGPMKPRRAKWNVEDPVDQIFELLRAERQTVRRDEVGDCKLSASLLLTLVTEDYKDMLGVPFACEAFEIFFTHASVEASGSFLEKWLEAASSDRDIESAWLSIHQTLILGCSRLSVKKTHWFTKHVIHFVLSRSSLKQYHNWVKDVVLYNAALVLGGVDKSEIDEVVQTSKGESSDGSADSKSTCVGALGSNEKHSEDDVLVHLKALYDIIDSSCAGIGFIETWMDSWCSDDAKVLIPWSYVWGVSQLSLEGKVANNLRLSSFADHLIRKYLRGVILSETVDTITLARIHKVISFVLRSSHEHALPFLRVILDNFATKTQLSPKSNSQVQALVLNVTASIFAQHSSTRALIANKSSVNALSKVLQLVTQRDATGALIRKILCNGRLVRVISDFIKSAKYSEANTVLDIVVRTLRFEGEQVAVWSDPMFIQAALTLVYRVKPSTTYNSVIVIESLSRCSPKSATAVLWCILRLCTLYCCGCSPEAALIEKATIRSNAIQLADMASQALGRMKTLPSDVLLFIQQHIASCRLHEARWNYFLMQFVNRIVQPAVTNESVALVRFIISPRADIDIDIMRLQLLNTFCNMLASTSDSASWRDGAILVTSNQLRASLRDVIANSTCSTSVALAESISRSSFEVKKLLDGCGR